MFIPSVVCVAFMGNFPSSVGRSSRGRSTLYLKGSGDLFTAILFVKCLRANEGSRTPDLFITRCYPREAPTGECIKSCKQLIANLFTILFRIPKLAC